MPGPNTIPPCPLPDDAVEYLKAPHRKDAEPDVRIFHQWLQKHELTLANLRPQHVRVFFKETAGTTNNKRCIRIRCYIDWLRSRGRTDFDSTYVKVHRFSLPQVAEDFLARLETVRRPTTCWQYRSAISGLHRWLETQKTPLQKLQRQDLVCWLQHLHERGISPCGRVAILCCVRIYLRHLNESRLLRRPADDLIRQEDLPKIPKYLPRPLPPAADKELQQRLKNSDCRFQKGLLLMRKTGLRVGELASLEFDCLRVAHNDNRYLKVPLGKLNNERLVPLDEETWCLVQKLQQDEPSPRVWLIETRHGRKTHATDYNHALTKICQGLDIPDRVGTHRLRHSCATELLNAGMSLTALMKFLGHRDYHMTLRYTAITQESVGREYFQALSANAKRHQHRLLTDAKDENFHPEKLIADLIRWLDKQANEQPAKARRIRLVAKRLKKIRQEVVDLHL